VNYWLLLRNLVDPGFVPYEDPISRWIDGLIHHKGDAFDQLEQTIIDVQKALMIHRRLPHSSKTACGVRVATPLRASMDWRLVTCPHCKGKRKC